MTPEIDRSTDTHRTLKIPNIPVDTYRVLVVDDDPDVREGVRSRIERLELAGPVHVLEAANEQRAREFMSTVYVDLVLLDIVLSRNESDGSSAYEVLSSLTRDGCRAKVVMMTHYDTSRHFDRIMHHLTDNAQPRVIKFFKTEEISNPRNLSGTLKDCLAEFVRGGVQVEGVDLVAGLIDHRRKRYPKDGNVLRHRAQLPVEIDRLCRKVFGTKDGHQRSTDVRVRLERFNRRGLSAAVLVRAIVSTTVRGSSHGPQGDFECILKLGPVADIKTETDRYDEYVRFGVELKQRVELLGSAADQGIGAIAYSFAGGVYGPDIHSLDELLRTDRTIARTVIENLFASTNWYSVQAPRAAIREHIDRQFRATVTHAVDHNASALTNLAHRHDFIRFRRGQSGTDSILQVTGGPALTLPGSDFLNAGWQFREFPQCLVHGDMHGGNIMVETGPPDGWPEGAPGAPLELRRVCLIDYRSAGPGPRCLDAVALEASVRISHSEEVAGITEADPDGTVEVHEAMKAAVRQYDTEKQLYELLFRADPKPPPSAEWCQLAGTVISGLRTAFADIEVASEEVDFEEYVQTALLYVVRQLNYDVPEINRIRLCAWLAALYSIAKDLFIRRNVA